MQHLPHCPLVNMPHPPPVPPVRGETPPPTYEEVIVRPRDLGHGPANTAASVENQEGFGDPRLDQENLPPMGVLQYEENVGEWRLFPEFPPPNSSLFHRRLQARLVAELARCDQQSAVPAADPVLPDRAPLQLLAAVHPLQPEEPDLQALEELPEEGDSGDTMPPPVPDNTFDPDPEPMMVDQHEEDLYVTADGSPPSEEQDQGSPSSDGARAAESVGNKIY